MDDAVTAGLRAELETLTAGITALDAPSMEIIQNRLDILTKPQGSLGQLENLARQLGGIQRTARPVIQKKAVLLMCGDHGVAAEGVSAFPQEVTLQMIKNIQNGGAAINVLARQAGAGVFCTDVGVAFPVEGNIIRKRVADGTRNMAQFPAMTGEQALRAILVGAEVARERIEAGYNLLATGDLGIGNTTPSSAIIALLTDSAPESVVDRGTGLDERGLENKILVIERAIALHQPDPQDPADVLAKVGGLEIAAIAGAVLQAAASRTAIVIDGLISTAGALIAAKLAPSCRDFMIPSHNSAEAGHVKALAELGLEPLLHLNMRLGEGTGAVLAFPIIEAALRVLEEMATFSDAGVSEKITV